MGKVCCAVGCHNRQDSPTGQHFYRIPADPERSEKWIAPIRRENWAPNQHTRLRSAHFISGQKSDVKWSPDYVPSIVAYVNSPQKCRRKRSLENFHRREIWRKTIAAMEKRNTAASALISLGLQATDKSGNPNPAAETEDPPPGTENATAGTETEDTMNELFVQTDLRGEQIDRVFSDNQSLREENMKLKEQIQNNTFDDFKHFQIR